MLKKITLTGGLVIIPAGSSSQVLVGMLVSLAYLLLIVRFEPYEDITEDRMQMCTSLQILFNLLTGLILRLDRDGEYEPNTIGIILIAMNAVVIVLSLVITLAVFKQKGCCNSNFGLVITLLGCKQLAHKEEDDKQIENGRGGALELKSLPVNSFKWVDNPFAKEDESQTIT